MEDTDELRWALKVVIKRQMRDLLQQLHDVGEEMAILSVNVSEGTASHFGTSQGEWFLSEQKNIKGSFLKYCQSMSKKSAGKPNLQPWLEDINATLESSITTNEEHISPEPSGSSKKSQADQRMLAAKGKKPQPVYLSGKKASKEPGKAVIKIKVPKGMITSGTSDKDLSGLVGRLLDQELKAQKSKTAASDTDTQNKFSSLLEAANIAKEQVKKTLGKRAGSDDAQSVSKRTRRSGPASGESPEKGGGDTTRSLRSGRAVSSRFLEGIASLKPKTLGKDKKDESDAEEHSDMDHSESMNLEGAELETVSAQLSKELEQMTLPVLERLETATSEGEVFDDREIKRQGVTTSIVSQKDLATSLQSTSTETVSTMSDFDSAFQKFLIENCPSTDDTTPTRIIITVDNGGGPVVEETVDILPSGTSGQNVDTNIELEQNLQTINSDDIANAGMNEVDDEQFGDDLYVAEKAVVSTLNHPYACLQCNKIYPTRRKLYLHNYTNHGSSVFRCGVCRREFKRPNNLKGHMVLIHSQQCPKCDTINIENGVWAENTKRTDERQIACTGCGEILTMRSRHGPQHKRVTKEGGGFVKIGSMVKCTECGKLFTRESAYKRHSILHMAEKPHHCHLCVKSFTLRATLRSHLRMFHPDASLPEIP